MDSEMRQVIPMHLRQKVIPMHLRLQRDVLEAEFRLIDPTKVSYQKRLKNLEQLREVYHEINALPDTKKIIVPSKMNFETN